MANSLLGKKPFIYKNECAYDSKCLGVSDLVQNKLNINNKIEKKIEF